MPSTNEIWAFTPGRLDGRGWLSEKAGGGDMGLYRELQTGVKLHKRVLLAIPALGNRTKVFGSFLKPNQKAGIFGILVFDPDPNIKRFLMKILLKGVTVEKPIMPGLSTESERASYNQVSLKVDAIDWQAP